MLSILIPTYNYSAYALCEELEKQALRLDIPFEIICRDDGSFSHLNIENQKINSLTNAKFIEAKKNIGRVKNRHELANEAQYDYVLFVDADTFPKSKNYLKNYLDNLYKSDCVFGGFAYDKNSLKPNYKLRYTFGKEREEIDADTRNKNPYKVIISANFLIKKSLFLKINPENQTNTYGMDYLFGSLLKANKALTLHINNEVYHYGIDSNQDFLNKTTEAIISLKKIVKNNKNMPHDISVLKAYQKLKSLGLTKLFVVLIKPFESSITSNLLGKKPYLFWFDIFKLYTICKS